MLILPIAILAMPSGEDRDFMETLYREHYRVMLATAKRYCSEEADIDDLISESCLRLMDRIDQLRKIENAQRRSFVIATVRAAAYARKIKLMRDARMFAQEKSVEEYEIKKREVDRKISIFDELDSVMEAVKRLPEKERYVLQMKFQMEMHDEEIAIETGLSEASVRKYVQRAREHLRGELGITGKRKR